MVLWRTLKTRTLIGSSASAHEVQMDVRTLLDGRPYITSSKEHAYGSPYDLILCEMPNLKLVGRHFEIAVC